MPFNYLTPLTQQTTPSLNYTTNQIQRITSSSEEAEEEEEQDDKAQNYISKTNFKQKQMNRMTTFFQFCNPETGILLYTDVAARGLDIPAVDCIVQFDRPDDPKEYIHRVWRTARGEGGSGHAFLLLRPEELGFLRYLKQAKVPLNEFEFSWNKISDIQLQLKKLMSKTKQLSHGIRGELLTKLYVEDALSELLVEVDHRDYFRQGFFADLARRSQTQEFLN
ncbi:hypothetical protein FQA39_LY02423 [Lamprigera yunnana]|nr:hypothetical protein FQA39_LY02423 [Lamprigera yunnana]